MTPAPTPDAPTNERLDEIANGATIYGHERDAIARELKAARATIAEHGKFAETAYSRIDKLRPALIECGRIVGGSVDEKCSDDFLCEIPKEVDGVVSKLRTKLAALAAPQGGGGADGRV